MRMREKAGPTGSREKAEGAINIKFSPSNFEFKVLQKTFVVRPSVSTPRCPLNQITYSTRDFCTGDKAHIGRGSASHGSRQPSGQCAASPLRHGTFYGSRRHAHL